MLSLWTQAAGVLSGKGGVLAQWFQRFAVVTSLHALGSHGRSLPRGAMGEAATAALDALATALPKVPSHRPFRCKTVGMA
jgi:hypothetical protein